MAAELSPSARKVQLALQAHGLGFRVIELAESTRTAADAAQAIGCQVGQIVKTLVFATRESGRPVLVLASGANRVNEQALKSMAGEALVKADADFVRQHTGFVIGGVPPVGHPSPLETYIDQDLFQYSEVWAAAGTPHAVFSLAPADLLAMTGGRQVRIT
ncbi:MAG: YbaK/EbsC family protein [Anaerolineales bacterium]|nr:YbaK/EbsC family protein [Anaerolineales bacterium]